MCCSTNTVSNTATTDSYVCVNISKVKLDECPD
jgi:hypothetical protein